MVMLTVVGVVVMVLGTVQSVWPWGLSGASEVLPLALMSAYMSMILSLLSVFAVALAFAAMSVSLPMSQGLPPHLGLPGLMALSLFQYGLWHLGHWRGSLMYLRGAHS